MLIDVTNLEFRKLNQKIREASSEISLTGCHGQRFIAAGMDNKHITIEGIPGNALGAYLNGASIVVKANAQDAVGDTMNEGEIIIHGNIGDAAGYAMRGGKIYIKGNAGYRAGIHMKEYEDKIPIMIIGGSAGSFLGEYQAGGIIIVLGLLSSNKRIVGNFPCTGMHGGKIYLRGNAENVVFPQNVCVAKATETDMALINEEISSYCNLFGYNVKEVLNTDFTVVTPDTKNPYKQMYVAN